MSFIQYIASQVCARGAARCARFAGPIAFGFSALLLAACAQQGAAVSGGPSGPEGQPVKVNVVKESEPFSPSSGPGSYLAGLHAERLGDVVDAASFMNFALQQDPGNLDLMQRSFLLTLADGKIEEAQTLAHRLADQAPEAPIPALAVAIEDFKHGNFKPAEARLKALPETGLNKFFVPLVMAWVKAGEGDTDGALAALDPLAQNSGFAVLHDLHAGLINDVAGRNDAAEAAYKNAIEGSQGGALRLVQALGSLYERTNRADEAKKIYDKYLKDNPDTILLDIEMKRLASGAVARPLVANAVDGMAEALFNVASTLQQQNASLLALNYARLALYLKSDFPVCQVLIADVFDAEGRGAESVALYAKVDKDSPFYWLGRMRIAIDLDAQGKTDDAIAKLNEMTIERPERVDALVTMGDILRAHDRFQDAADAYTRALGRVPKLEERHWAILYARSC